MITTIFSLTLSLIFIVLSGFHIYWFRGGTWGLEQAIPTKESGPIALEIPKAATLMVAVVLIFFALIYLNASELITFPFPYWISKYALWFIPLIFILRGIGEFNYVGLFKKIKNTKFANADTKIFTPLCFFIGLIGLIIQLWPN